jgi:ribosomal protein S11
MIFTLANDNQIMAHATEAQAEETSQRLAGTIVVRSQRELAKAAATWPASRLTELWNSFAGVVPFTDCKPVKKFENRDKGVRRLWAAMQRLGQGMEAVPTADPHRGGEPKARRPDTKKAGAKGAGKPAASPAREGTRKAQVIAMLQRPGGATLAEIQPYASHCTSLAF